MIGEDNGAKRNFNLGTRKSSLRVEDYSCIYEPIALLLCFAFIGACLMVCFLRFQHISTVQMKEWRRKKEREEPMFKAWCSVSTEQWRDWFAQAAASVQVVDR